MRPFRPSQVPYLLSLIIHLISAQLHLGTQLGYPTEFDISPVLPSTDGLVPKEDYASNTDDKDCHSPNLQRRIRARAYNNDDPSSGLCPYEPGPAAPPQYNFKQPPEADQQQLDGTKNDPNNPDPNPHPETGKQRWWEKLITPIQDLVRPGRDERNDNRKAPPMSSALCPDPKRQVAVCSAETPFLPGPGELVIEYCRFSAFHFLLCPLQPPIDIFFWGGICLSVHTTSLLEKSSSD